MPNRDRDLTEEQARALWERAARLQAEAAAREMAGEGDSEADGTTVSRREDGAYPVDVVRRAAIEAGIGDEFVERALEEFALDGEAPGLVDRWADRYLGDGPRVLRVTRTIDASPEVVYAAMQRVLPNPPFSLALAGTEGRSVLDGGALIFDVPTIAANGQTLTGGPIMDIRYWADIRELRFRIRALEGDSPRTEIEVSASLAHARRTNFWAGNGVSGFIGVVAGVIGAGVASAVIDPVAGAGFLTAFGIGGGAGVGTFAGMNAAWRPIFRSSMRKGERGMRKLLDAVAVDIQTGGGFTQRAPPRIGGDPGTEFLSTLSL